ncbi:hypothetical protein [Kallotenue papyrolyticum]|nr:hypothetical protein [Kallotenue papyrolyticum]
MDSYPTRRSGRQQRQPTRCAGRTTGVEAIRGARGAATRAGTRRAAA